MLVQMIFRNSCRLRAQSWLSLPGFCNQGEGIIAYEIGNGKVKKPVTAGFLSFVQRSFFAEPQILGMKKVVPPDPFVLFLSWSTYTFLIQLYVFDFFLGRRDLVSSRDKKFPVCCQQGGYLSEESYLSAAAGTA